MEEDGTGSGCAKQYEINKTKQGITENTNKQNTKHTHKRPDLLFDKKKKKNLTKANTEVAPTNKPNVSTH